MRSLRARLLLGTLSGTAAVLLGCGVFLYAITQAQLIRELDQALTARAATLASLVEQEKGRLEVEFDYRVMPEFARAERPEYFQIWRENGSTLARSPSLEAGDLQPPDSSNRGPVARDVTLPDGRAGRCVALRTTPRVESVRGQPQQITVAIAKSTADLQRALARIRGVLAAAAVGALVLSGLFLTLAVARGLRPVNQLAHSISRLQPEHLSARIHLDRPPLELVPVIDQTNSLLRRIETMVQREKSFTAEVAHELRTPLAGLRSTLEISLSRDRDAEAYRTDLSASLRITEQIQAMVANLLSLARMEAGAVAVHVQQVHLPSLLAECWAPLEERVAAKGLQVAWLASGEATLQTDREKLRQVVSNLFDNAVTYAEPQGRVTVELAANAETIEFSVANTGSRMSESDAGKAFDRFWRGDASRSETGVHCGLGLPLVSQFVQLLGGTVQLDLHEKGMFRVTVRLPAIQHKPGTEPSAT